MVKMAKIVYFRYFGQKFSFLDVPIVLDGSQVYNYTSETKL